ncbi:ATP-binding protein [Kitasatospora azatica]|uniref:ATP-binding protein n=1 Tax=Kitasatospora azatica TaxID=58347 RepID=UPI000B254BD8|nr:LuxR family transcriptional regulator [Kitasatospora azatica]
MAGTVDQQSATALGRGFTFVGRRRELGLLLAAARHPPAVVMLEGEAGIGKSRLVREAARILGTEGHRVVTGFCHPLREPQPYGPVMDALRRTGPLLPATGIPPTAGALAPLLPDLADRLPPAPPGPDDPGTVRHRLIQAVRSLLGAIGPAVLVIEDLHWADQATRELLLLLARDLPEHLALVLTYRAQDLPPGTPVLGTAYRHPPNTTGAVIHLPALSSSDIEDLASAALGPRATPELCSALYRRSEGLPLVAEEDLITLREQGDQHGRHDVRELEHSGVPSGLREAITERLTALSEPGAAVVDAAAVLAVPATEELLTKVAGLDSEAGADGLIDALQASLLRQTDSGLYAFHHVLGLQVAYQHIPGPKRARLHRRAIEALQNQHPVPLVQIAHHTLAAGDRAAWLQRVEAAADQAIALADTGTAATLLNQLLGQPDLASGPRSRAALSLAQIARFGVDLTASAAVLRRILADPRLPEATRGEIRLGLGLLVSSLGADRAGLQEIERAVGELATRPEQAARAMVALAVDERSGDPEHGWRWLERAEQTLGPNAGDAIRMTVHGTRLTLMGLAGDPALWPLVDRLPRQTDHPETLYQIVRSVFNLGEAAIDVGHDQRAEALLTETRELAVRAGAPRVAFACDLELLRLDAVRGHWAGLEERFAAIGRENPDMAMVGIEESMFLGQLAAARGVHSTALQHFSTAAEFGARDFTATLSLRAAAGLAAVRLAQGDPRDAWAIVSPALVTLRTAPAWARATGLTPVAVEAALACGERSAAEALVEETDRELQHRDAPGAVAELETARGMLVPDGEPLVAATRFGQAASMWQQIGRPYHRTQAAERQALALARAGSTDAIGHLTEAHDSYTRLGATGDAARCQHELHRLGADPSPQRGRRGYGNELSPRELEVARLLAGGATNHDIAEALFLSQRTVEKHVAAVLRKLGTERKDVGGALGD